MSARNLQVVLSPKAAADLRNFFRYSERIWGIQQAEQYQAEVFAVFRLLASKPMIDRTRFEIGPEVRSYAVESHVVIYKPISLELMILRVMHHCQDPTGINDV